MKDDILIQNNVISELKWEPRVNAAAIGVSVKDGIVTLNGYVSSFTEKLAAEKVASAVVGVKGVAQELKVKLPQAFERDDADIAEAAVNALEWNTLVPDDRIKVEVQDGMAVLSGEVDWEYQRAAAHDVAGRHDEQQPGRVAELARGHQQRRAALAGVQRDADRVQQRLGVVQVGDGNRAGHGHQPDQAWRKRPSRG